LLGQKFFVDLTGFFNQSPLSDTIPAPTHLLLPAQFGNSLEGNTSGVEMAPEWRPASFWGLRGSYSFLVMHLKKAPGSLDIGTAPGIQGASPQHQVFLQSGFDFSKAMSLDLFYRYVSDLPAQSVRAYSTGNATFAWHMTDHFGISLVGQNLFQPHHAEFLGDPSGLVEIKRSVYAKITWTRK
jgi:iron complex outermembrane receptor protein